MRLFTFGERARLTSFAVVAVLMAVAHPASASNWGHLRGPFSIESLQRERANFAAEEWSIHRAPALLAPAFWSCGHGMCQPHRIVSVNG